MLLPSLLPSLLFAASCSLEAEPRKIGQIVHEDAPRPPGPGETQPALVNAPLYFAARSASGAVVLASLETGAVVSESPATGAPHRGVDLVFDVHRDRLVAVDEDVEGASSTVSALALSWSSPGAPALGAREELGYLDGLVRFAAVPAGLVGFEESYGTRWRLWPEGAPPTPSVAAPHPWSAWPELGDGGDFRLGALVRPSGGVPEVRAAEVGPSGVGPLTGGSLALPSLSGDPDVPCRVARDAPSGRAALVELAGGSAVFHDLAPGVAAPIVLPGAALGVEHVLLLREGRVALALFSSPTRLVAVDLESGAAPATLDIPAEVRVADRYFSRELLAAGDHRALVATDRGVVAVRLEESASGLALAFDVAFDGASLEGPLAGPIPAP